MDAGKLMGIGIGCCIGALVVNIAPGPAYSAGIDPKAVWQAFAFGVFLIVLGAFAGARGRNGSGRTE